MANPIAHAARAAADRLAAEHGPGLTADVEAALHARGSTQQPEQYPDPLSLGSLIVSIATLAWTVYIDLRKSTPKPSHAVIGRTIRVRLPNDDFDPTQRDRIIDIIVEKTIQVEESSN